MQEKELSKGLFEVGTRLTVDGGFHCLLRITPMGGSIDHRQAYLDMLEMTVKDTLPRFLSPALQKSIEFYHERFDEKVTFCASFGPYAPGQEIEVGGRYLDSVVALISAYNSRIN